VSGRTGSVAYDERDFAPFQTGAPVFLYLGRFTAVKRLPLLIAAHARASERLDTPAPLVLVGGHPGEWEGEHPLTAAARLGNKHVFLAGWRAHELVPQALNAADLLVLPSLGEAFGLVLVEAMACGLPVVACAAHGPAEIVADGKTGWLVPPDGLDALSDALVTAASDREERRARGGRAYAESRRYAWPAVARRLASLYEELLAPAPERAARAGR
jgi:glycosyltransferase involved in cell wall biosynthesis